MLPSRPIFPPIMSCCAFDCYCFTPDREKQVFGIICCNKQSGIVPCLFCSHDDDGMCWGCVCCGCQVDPCWAPRNVLNCFFMLIPCCGVSCQTVCFKIFCCNNRGHGKNDKDTDIKTVKAAA